MMRKRRMMAVTSWCLMSRQSRIGSRRLTSLRRHFSPIFIPQYFLLSLSWFSSNFCGLKTFCDFCSPSISYSLLFQIPLNDYLYFAILPLFYFNAPAQDFPAISIIYGAPPQYPSLHFLILLFFSLFYICPFFSSFVSYICFFLVWGRKFWLPVPSVPGLSCIIQLNR